MLGKIRVALSPPQPNWMFTALHLNARGFTTGFVPYGSVSIEASLDVFDSRITIGRSDGARFSLDLLPARTIAEIYKQLSAALNAAGVRCKISTVPQELLDTTPFDQNRRPGEYDPRPVLDWFRAATAVAAEFERWRAHFFGRSGIQLWWGAFDVALILFSGRRVKPPLDRGYLMKYDLDAELMNVGLYLGDERNAPFLYGYIYPEPANASELAIRPPDAFWSGILREWVLPYETLRTRKDSKAAIRQFLDSIYDQCFEAAGWKRDAYTYDAPPNAPGCAPRVHGA